MPTLCKKIDHLEKKKFNEKEKRKKELKEKEMNLCLYTRLMR